MLDNLLGVVGACLLGLAPITSNTINNTPIKANENISFDYNDVNIELRSQNVVGALPTGSTQSRIYQSYITLDYEYRFTFNTQDISYIDFRNFSLSHTFAYNGGINVYTTTGSISSRNFSINIQEVEYIYLYRYAPIPQSDYSLYIRYALQLLDIFQNPTMIDLGYISIPYFDTSNNRFNVSHANSTISTPYMYDIGISSMLDNVRSVYGYGVNNARIEGYNEGLTEGYNKGYREGKASNSVLGGFELVTLAFTSITSLLAVEVFPNITIGYLMAIPLVILVLFFIFRLLRGGSD